MASADLASIRTAQYVYGMDTYDFRRVAAVVRTGHTTRAAYVRDLTPAERQAYDTIRHLAQNRSQRALQGR